MGCSTADPYIKFAVDDAEAQTMARKDDSSPLFTFGCWFLYSGNADLRMTLWDRDEGMFNSDDEIGSVGYNAEKGVELPASFETECKTQVTMARKDDSSPLFNF